MIQAKSVLLKDVLSQTYLNTVLSFELKVLQLVNCVEILVASPVRKLIREVTDQNRISISKNRKCNTPAFSFPAFAPKHLRNLSKTGTSVKSASGEEFEKTGNTA